MVLVAVELIAFASHAARHLGPAIVLPVGETLLNKFQRYDIVGCGESAGPVEGEECIEPARARGLRFFNRPEGPRGHVHLAGTIGKERAHGYGRTVIEHEIGEDDQIAVGVADALRALGTETSDQLRT